MSITEMKTAIRKLPVSEVGELMTWLERYHEQTWDKQIAADLDAGHLDDLLAEVDAEYEAGRFDAIVDKAFASGDPSPLTKSDIDAARRIVKNRIAH